jgi:hypothetical protein
MTGPARRYLLAYEPCGQARATRIQPTTTADGFAEGRMDGLQCKTRYFQRGLPSIALLCLRLVQRQDILTRLRHQPIREEDQRSERNIPASGESKCISRKVHMDTPAIPMMRRTGLPLLTSVLSETF